MKPLNIFGSLIFLLCACQGNSSEKSVSAETEKPATKQIPVAEVTVSENSYNAPAELSAGYVTIQFTNTTQELHSAHLIKLEEGHGQEELIEAYSEAINTVGTRPAWMKHRGGVIAEPGTGELTLQLEPGNYVWVCVMGEDSEEGSHFTGHEIRSLVVSGHKYSNQTLSAPDAIIRMKDDNHELTTELQAGNRSIEIQNTGTKDHLAVIVKLNKEATSEDVKTWYMTFQGPPPATSVAATTALAPGYSARLDISLESGKYVMFCYANAEGSPHLTNGAIRSFNVE